MLHRFTGKIVHIDFGDCFEVAMRREKFPETVPFRLTRMLVNAMEISAVEGTFRSTCVGVMSVLRSHQDSLMAMLEAFIHDPLIKWRLLQPEATQGTALARTTTSVTEPAGHSAPPQRRAEGTNRGDCVSADTSTGTGVASLGKSGGAVGDLATPAAVAMATAAHERSLSLSRRNSLAPSLRASLEESFGYNSANSPSSLSSMARQRTRSMSAHDSMLLEGSVEPEALNERAIRVIHRVDDKLTGREFGKEELSVSSQVQRLIEAATAHQNLCQCFVGWCPSGERCGDRMPHASANDLLGRRAATRRSLVCAWTP